MPGKPAAGARPARGRGARLTPAPATAPGRRGRARSPTPRHLLWPACGGWSCDPQGSRRCQWFRRRAQGRHRRPAARTDRLGGRPAAAPSCGECAPQPHRSRPRSPGPPRRRAEAPAPQTRPRRSPPPPRPSSPPTASPQPRRAAPPRTKEAARALPALPPDVTSGPRRARAQGRSCRPQPRVRRRPRALPTAPSTPRLYGRGLAGFSPSSSGPAGGRGPPAAERLSRRGSRSCETVPELHCGVGRGRTGGGRENHVWVSLPAAVGFTVPTDVMAALSSQIVIFISGPASQSSSSGLCRAGLPGSSIRSLQGAESPQFTFMATDHFTYARISSRFPACTSNPDTNLQDLLVTLEK